jgi:hypothetical protein
MNYVVESRAFNDLSATRSANDLLAQTADVIAATRNSVAVYRTAGGLHYPVVVKDVMTALTRVEEGETLHAVLPPMYPEWLGDRGFVETHGARFGYVAGEMARGIASVKMVIAAVWTGFVGFFGSAGLGLSAIAEALSEITHAVAVSKIIFLRPMKVGDVVCCYTDLVRVVEPP